MKRLLAVLGVVLFVGCGSGVTQTTVGGSAREKCRGGSISDTYIDTLFIDAEAFKAEGFSAAEQLSFTRNACNESCGPYIECALNCTDCSAAIIDEVYRD